MNAVAQTKHDWSDDETIQLTEAGRRALVVADAAENLLRQRHIYFANQMMEDGDALLNIVGQIIKERQRAEDLCRAGKFPWTPAHTHIDDAKKLGVLAEEMGEVTKEVNELPPLGDDIRAGERVIGLQRLRTELMQVASVAAGWAASITTKIQEEGR